MSGDIDEALAIVQKQDNKNARMLLGSYMIKRQSLSYHSKTSIIVQLQVLANKKIASTKVSCNRDVDDSVDIHPYMIE